MPIEYTLADLARLAKVTPRTVRYYISQGLLPPPTQSGSAARYGDGHLDRLRLIKKLQAAHLPLAEIRSRLRALPQDELARLAEGTAGDEPQESALDYIETVLDGPTAGDTHYSLPMRPPTAAVAARAIEPPALASMPAAPLPDAATAAPDTEPERAQWERITLDPDVELHIRRPLSRQQNKRVERLISIARQLLEED